MTDEPTEWRTCPVCSGAMESPLDCMCRGAGIIHVTPRSTAVSAELSNALQTIQKLGNIVHGMANAVLLLSEPDQLPDDRDEAARQLRAHAAATKRMLEGWGLEDPLEGELQEQPPCETEH